jgi:hypothetical protein
MYNDFLLDLGPHVKCVVIHSLKTEFKEENFIKEYHAVPSSIHKIREEL